MKSLTLLFLLISLNGFAQTYAEKLAAFRTKYKQDFLKDANAPLKKKDLSDLHFYEADSSYQVLADVEFLHNQAPFPMPTYDGTSKEFIRYARVNFILKGQKLQMTLYKSLALAKISKYKNLLFLPFRDGTNNGETYGGGRYIDLNLTDIDRNDQIIIDFNKAYNPYCAYSDGYRCPVPPPENELPADIKAGEQLYTGPKKHKP